jgi:hypothetical protein
MSCTFSGSPRLREEVDRFLARPQLPFVGQILRRQLAHLGFDLLEVFGHERLRHDEVVEEALVGGRTDAALTPGKQVGHRRGEQVRRRVTIEGERVPRRRQDELERCVCVSG